jgi:hypothetical protein
LIFDGPIESVSMIHHYGLFAQRLQPLDGALLRHQTGDFNL